MDGKNYRITIDGDCHTFAYRKDYFGEGGIGGAEVPKTWQQVNEVSKALVGQTDPLTGLPAHGYLDPLKGWGGFGFYFIENRAAAYVKHPDDRAWLFDPDTMKPRVNNPGWVQAIQDVMDLIAANAYPADQINADPRHHSVPAVSWLARAPCSCGGATWGRTRGPATRPSWGDVVGFGINPGSDRRYNAAAGAWEETYNEAPNMAYIGWGVYVTSRVSGDELKRKAAWSAAAHLGGKDLSLWTAAYPSGFQPYRNSHFNYDEWEAAGYDRAFVEDYLGSNADSYNHPNAAIEPRIPGIFQYYSVAEDELAKGFAGQYASAQETADAIAAAWEAITDQIGTGEPDRALQGEPGDLSFGGRVRPPLRNLWTGWPRGDTRAAFPIVSGRLQDDS